MYAREIAFISYVRNPWYNHRLQDYNHAYCFLGSAICTKGSGPCTKVQSPACGASGQTQILVGGYVHHWNVPCTQEPLPFRCLFPLSPKIRVFPHHDILSPQRPKSSKTNRLWAKISKTMGQIKPFILLNWFSLVFCHSNKKLTHTKSSSKDCAPKYPTTSQKYGSLFQRELWIGV